MNAFISDEDTPEVDQKNPKSRYSARMYQEFCSSRSKLAVVKISPSVS